MENSHSTEEENVGSKKNDNKPSVSDSEHLPLEAIESGFTSLQDWNSAREGGFSIFEEWAKAKKGGFDQYDHWLEAQNEGFDNKIEWEDWEELKNSGFTDIDLFFETKDISFYQTGLRRAFISHLKLAKKRWI